jgi:hypothetical protein
LRIGPLLATALLGGLAAMVAIFFLVRGLLGPGERSADQVQEMNGGERLQGKIASAKKALHEGSFSLAADLFNEAVRMRDAWAEAVSPEESSQLNQWQRQSELLAGELRSPLEEVLRAADESRNDEAWNAQFKREYLNRRIIFDDIVVFNQDGQPALRNEMVKVPGVAGRVELEGLELLDHLPLQPPRRWLFGASLASLNQEPGAVWVFRFRPDSGVLLTDRQAVLAWRKELGMDPEFDELMERQAAALSRLPSPRPSP